MTTYNRHQFNAIMRAAPVSGVLTNLQAGRMGMNVGQLTSGQYSRFYVDYTRRSYSKFLIPGTGTPVALDGSGNPTATYEYILTANPLTNDLGTYTVVIPNGTCDAIAKSTATVTTTVSFGSLAPDGLGNSVCTMNLTAGGGSFGLKITNPSVGAGPPIVLPAGFTLANKNDFHPDSILQSSLGTTLRSLNWVLVNGSTETDWAGSLAAGGDGTIKSASQSLSEFCRYARACGNANIWLNIVALATDDYVLQFCTTADTLAPVGATIYIEWSDETWNNAFPAYDQMTQVACALAGTYAGSTSGIAPYYASATNTITSCSRTSNVATAVITGAPKNGNGSHVYVSGITNITGGYVTLTNVVNNGNGTYSISWAETGADVTGTLISGHSYSSYIHTDVEPGAPHYLVKGSTTYGPQPSPNFVTPYVMKGRYVVERLRVAYNTIQTLPGKARFKLVMNNKVGSGTGDGLSENEVYPYALERWGDHSWIAGIASAPYFANSNTSTAASTDAVITLLSANLDTFPQLLARDGNGAASWGHDKLFYEGGPGTEIMGTAGAYIGAAHRDTRMGALITRLMTYMRDLGQTGPFCYFQGGASATFGAINESCWSLHENGVITDFTTPKAAALLAWGAASSVPAPMDGYTSGTINIPTVWSSYFGNSDINGCRIAPSTSALPPCGIQVVKTVAGNYPISVYLCSSNVADWVSLSINGVEIAHQIPLTLQNPISAAPSTPVYTSASYPMNAGKNIVLITIKPTGRSGTVGYYQIVSPDTPV